MATKKIFSVPQTIVIPGIPSKTGALVSVSIGASTTAKQYLLINQAGGRQPFRTQYDIALDGTQYVLAADKGLGDYEFTMLDGVVQCGADSPGTQNSESFIEAYKNMRKAEDRKILITTGSGAKTLLFRGLINQMTATAVRGDNGEQYLQINLSAVGMWT